MRLGFVCLFAALLAAGDAAEQWQEPGAASPFVAPLNRAMVRADGSTFETDLPQRREPQAIPGAVSFRHYVHRPAKKARQYFAKGLRAVELNNEIEALSQLTEAVRVDPEYFEAHAQLGSIYLANEMHDEALLHLERALAIDSSSQLVQGLAAWSLLKLGKFAEAETAAKRALQLGRTIPVLEEVIRIAKISRASMTQTALAARPTP